jgi:hypothetical protein
MTRHYFGHNIQLPTHNYLSLPGLAIFSSLMTFVVHRLITSGDYGRPLGFDTLASDTTA